MPLERSANKVEENLEIIAAYRKACDDWDEYLKERQQKAIAWAKEQRKVYRSHLLPQQAKKLEDEDTAKIARANNRRFMLTHMKSILDDETTLDAEKVQELTDYCIKNRGLFEQSVDKKEEKAIMKILIITATVETLGIFAVLSGIILGFKALADAIDKGKPMFGSATRTFESKINEQLQKQITVMPLVRECDLYFDKLTKKERLLSEKAAALTIAAERDALTDKIERVNKKITCIYIMRDMLLNDRETPITRIEAFKRAFDEAKNKELAARDDKDTRIWLQMVGHLLATALTLGIYAAIRASYSANTRGTAKFWKTKRRVFTDETEQALDNLQKKIEDKTRSKRH